MDWFGNIKIDGKRTMTNTPGFDDKVLGDPRNKLKYAFGETPLRKMTVLVARTLLKGFVTMHVEGAENIPQVGACILASNHLSNFDVIPMQLAIKRPLFFMGKAELFKNSFLSWFFRQMGGFPVQRGANDQWALSHAREVIGRGLILAMFPEGTRSRGKGLSVAKTGAARLAIEKNIPIIPLSHFGSEFVLRDFPKRTLVTIKISAPIMPADDDDPLSLTDKVMFALASELPEGMRGVYSENPSGFTF